jgi:hypothetical protein
MVVVVGRLGGCLLLGVVVVVVVVVVVSCGTGPRSVN